MLNVWSDGVGRPDGACGDESFVSPGPCVTVVSTIPTGDVICCTETGSLFQQNLLPTMQQGSFLSFLTDLECPQCSVSADSALGFLWVHEPRGAALGLRIPLMVNNVTPRLPDAASWFGHRPAGLGLDDV